MKVEKALQEFILSAKADGLAVKTVKWYQYTIGTLVDAGADRDVESITTNELRQHIVALRERLAAESASGHVRALHRFFSWCSTEYELPKNPMSGIKRAAPSRSEPKAITSGDFIKLFNATIDSPAGVRDRAILAFFADTGVRLGGLLTLELDRVDMDNRRAHVREKGRKLRVVPFTHYTKVLLSHWLEVRVSSSTVLFTTVTGQPLTESGLHEILKRLKRRANVTGRVNPHAFRHAFAREYLRAGGDLVTLARLMGHEKIDTTAAFYAVFSSDELAEAHEKRSPLNTLLFQK